MKHLKPNHDIRKTSWQGKRPVHKLLTRGWCPALGRLSTTRMDSLRLAAPSRG